MKSRIVANAPITPLKQATTIVRTIEVSKTIEVILRFSSNMSSNYFFGPIKNIVLVNSKLIIVFC